MVNYGYVVAKKNDLKFVYFFLKLRKINLYAFEIKNYLYKDVLILLNLAM